MTLTVRLPETMESQLARFCEVMGISKSKAVQSALKDWFAKPVAMQQHPLLAFVQTSVSATPSADWPGPYSKDLLRQQVLMGGAAHSAVEPVATYQANPAAPVPRPKVVKKIARKKTAKNSSTTAVLASQIDPS
jgi:hypothetical protein